MVTTNGGAETLMLRFADVDVAVGVSESVTVIAKFDVPVKVPVGVPVMAPVLGFKFKPAGKLPEVTAQ